ncbi:MAG: helix-turn-helix transcriptional regulator [Thermoguttaceae bacterium]
MSNDQTHAVFRRQWGLLQTLCQAKTGITLKELASDMQVSIKTLRRDIASLRDVGVVIHTTTEKHGELRFTASIDNNIFLTPDETAALFISKNFLGILEGTRVGSALDSACEKLKRNLNESIINYAKQFELFFDLSHKGVVDFSEKREIIDDIMYAIKDSYILEVTYESLKSTQPECYKIHPYGLVYHSGSLYLVGHSQKNRQIRHWKIQRMLHTKLTTGHFERPADFDLRTHLAGSFGICKGEHLTKVGVKFSAKVARYVSEAKWHQSQINIPQKNGSLISEFTLDSTKELTRWVLSFGKDAQIIEPPELREKIKLELQELLKCYQE